MLRGIGRVDIPDRELVPELRRTVAWALRHP